MRKFIFVLFFLSIHLVHANDIQPAVTRSIPLTELQEFDKNDPKIKKLIERALSLADNNLTYQYGSAKPQNKGMDCSGTIYYLLKSFTINDVPRQSDQIYQWLWDKGEFHSVEGTDLNDKEFSQLKPGDLLFWTGTYKVKRAIPITHVMMYLGKNKKGEPLMFGSSNGRPYQGKKMWGVSIFDFILQSKGQKSKFVGYGCIPNYTCDLKQNS